MVLRFIVNALIFLYLFTTVFSYEHIVSRKKRFLLWPDGTHKVQVITGVGIPVDLERETAIFGFVFKANYQTPTNLSDITYPATIYARKKRGLSRWDIYSLLSQTAQMRGLPGKSCIMKAICEVADAQIDKANGLFDEILYTIFTPTTTNEELSHYTDNEYFAAHMLGSRGEGNCHKHFKECDMSFIDLITEYRHETERYHTTT